jgi:hypothetical protein
MFRKFALTGLVAASIAFAPITAPTAQARDNFDNLLIGLVTVGVIGAIVHQNKENRRTVVVQKRQVYHEPRRDDRRDHYRDHRRDDRRDHRHDHRDYKRDRNYVEVKPRECLRQKWTSRGWVQFYSERCLNEHRIPSNYGRKR